MSVRPRRVPFLLTVIVTVIILGVGLAQARILDISCQVREQACPAEITSALFTLKGKSLIWSDADQQIKAALQDQTGFRLVGIAKEYPDIISVTLEPQQLLYQLKLFQQDQFMAINDQGRVVPVFQPIDLPILAINETVWNQWQTAGELPSFTHQQLKNTSEIIKQAGLMSQGLLIIDEKTLAMYLPNNQTALLDIAELDSDIPRLKTILDGVATQELPQPIEEIDLRYKLPVLRFARSIPRHESL